MLIDFMREAPYWFGWLGILLVVSLSVYMAWKAWFADRAKGRRRCPKCWYDMGYTDGMTCSECGHVAHEEPDFNRTRRHRLRGFIAVFIAALAIILVREKTMDSGWAGVMPSRMLVWIMPLFSDADNDAVSQLMRRMNRGDLSEKNLLRLIERCARGDGGAVPGTEAWSGKYGTVLNRFRPALAARRRSALIDELEKPLLDLPPVITLHAREQWPVGSQARIGIQVRNWWPFGSDSRLRITPRFDGAEPENIYFRGANTPGTDYSLLTPPLDVTDSEIVFDIETSRRTEGPDAKWIVLDTQTRSVPISVSGIVEDMIEPVSDPNMDERMKRAMLGARQWIGGPRALRFYVAPGQTAVQLFDDVAVGFISELLLDGEVVLLDHTWWMGGPNVADRGFGSWSEDGTMQALRDMDLTTGTWEIRVKSDPLLAIRAGQASKYWNGEFTMPMPVQQLSGLAPEPHWWMDEEELPENDREETDPNSG